MAVFIPKRLTAKIGNYNFELAGRVKDHNKKLILSLVLIFRGIFHVLTGMVNKAHTLHLHVVVFEPV